MNKIQILPEQEALKIAAGEVVERPSSIVKELIENSIDAQSTQISLFIEKAGKNLIKIIDNGCGMSLDDAKICFAAHATSKIKSIKDLDNINTFGFRGEALAAISSVSKINLKTRLNFPEINLGHDINYIAGKFEKEEVVSIPAGTQITITDLFYNTPARQKFLKQDETELNQIYNVFYAFCLSYINIQFKLYNDNKLIYNIPAVDSIKDRLSQIFGHNFSQNFIELNEEENKHNIKISGLISNHHFYRYNRNQIYFFANNRYIKNRELATALTKGYLNVLPQGKFPAAFIFLNIENSSVDINVHPRKEEVKFSKPGTIETLLQKTVTVTLEKNLSNSLRTMPDNNSDNYIFQEKNYLNAYKTEENNNLQQDIGYNKQEKQVFFDLTPSINSKTTTQNCQLNLNQNFNPEQNSFNNCYSSLQEEIKSTTKKLSSNFKIIGQVLNTYILIENESGLLIIDQHAAHERILYEKYLKNFEKKSGVRLLFPEIINLQNSQIEKLMSEKDFFDNQGIEIEIFGQNQIAIKTSPPKVANQPIKEVILEAINFIEEHESLDKETFRKKLNEHVHSHLACKSAIKAGDQLTIEQMEQLLLDLNSVDNRFICIHGRPTSWQITKDQLEKSFRRR